MALSRLSQQCFLWLYLGSEQRKAAPQFVVSWLLAQHYSLPLDSSCRLECTEWEKCSEVFFFIVCVAKAHGYVISTPTKESTKIRFANLGKGTSVMIHVRCGGTVVRSRRAQKAAVYPFLPRPSGHKLQGYFPTPTRAAKSCPSPPPYPIISTGYNRRIVGRRSECEPGQHARDNSTALSLCPPSAALRRASLGTRVSERYRYCEDTVWYVMVARPLPLEQPCLSRFSSADHHDIYL